MDNQIQRFGFNSDNLASDLRKRVIIPSEKKILVANFLESDQENDITSGINCKGYGRLHLYNHLSDKWISESVPTDPASWKLGIPAEELKMAQLFQIAGCNYRCWYCYVDDKLLSGDQRCAKYLTSEELLDLYLNEEKQAQIIELTGGQPDLAPEWTIWMMESLIDRGLQDRFYLWQDDSLSCGYTWVYLNEKQREFIKSYRNYGRVCCIKSFTAEGFYETTGANPIFFDQQINLLSRLISWGIDLYVYVTFTIKSLIGAQVAISKFMDRLQTEVHPNIPLRVIPLEIKLFSPTLMRLNRDRRVAYENQYAVLEIWLEELDKKFSSADQSLPQYLVKLE